MVFLEGSIIMQARDYKSGAARSEAGNGVGRGGGKKRALNPMFVGIIIGLLLGIGLALSLAIWLNRANNPFVEKSRPVEALATLPGKSLSAPVPAAPAAPAATKGDAEKPRFEFYQILPDEKRGKADGVAPQKAAEPPARATTEPKSAPKLDKPEVKPPSGEVLHLQAGAFQNRTDAENMKAKVAFAGFEANVRPVNLPDKGTLFRVRLGPFKSIDEVNRIKATLSQGGIDAAVVKGSDN